jgi:hypothetical protein
MAAQHHDRVDPARAMRLDQLFAGQRIAAFHREEQPGPRKLATVHGDRALAEIDTQRRFDGCRRLSNAFMK